jgi:hypothetical protein
MNFARRLKRGVLGFGKTFFPQGTFLGKTMKTTTWKLAVAAGLLGLGGVARAGLIPYLSDGASLVYDNDYGALGLTWTANANLAASQTFGVSGIDPGGTMTWSVGRSVPEKSQPTRCPAPRF